MVPEDSFLVSPKNFITNGITLDHYLTVGQRWGLFECSIRNYECYFARV